MARTIADLKKPGIKFVHCVEGGFQLGDDPEALDERVRWLSEHGVLYVTVAHLFFRDLATEAPAIPLFTANSSCGLQRAHGRRAHRPRQSADRAMSEHKILIDVSHMSERRSQRPSHW